MKISLRVVAAVLIVVTGIGFVLTVWSTQLSDKNAAGRDFISYWATGQLLVKGQNPYDFDAVRMLERGAGRN